MPAQKLELVAGFDFWDPIKLNPLNNIAQTVIVLLIRKVKLKEAFLKSETSVICGSPNFLIKT